MQPLIALKQIAGIGAPSSGTYTPTLTNVANVSASTAYVCQWLRIGSVVNVSGKIDVTAAAILTTTLGLSLPVASNFAAAEQCAGSGGRFLNNEVVRVSADITNHRAQVDFVAAISAFSRAAFFTFQYLIVP